MDERKDAGADQWQRQLRQLWERRRPRILERVAVIEAVAAAEAPGAGEIEQARAEAHKLRGLLGTIGLPEGSEAAGAIEDSLAAGKLRIDEPLARLGELVRDHRA